MKKKKKGIYKNLLQYLTIIIFDIIPIGKERFHCRYLLSSK